MDIKMNLRDLVDTNSSEEYPIIEAGRHNLTFKGAFLTKNQDAVRFMFAKRGHKDLMKYLTLKDAQGNPNKFLGIFSSILMDKAASSTEEKQHLYDTAEKVGVLAAIEQLQDSKVGVLVEHYKHHDGRIIPSVKKLFSAKESEAKPNVSEQYKKFIANSSTEDDDEIPF